MTSHAPAQCCTIGVRHEGTPAGVIKDVGGISTYIAESKSKSTEYAILILPDVIGHKFNNVQLIADQFAANDYFVVVPDIFSGDTIPLNRPQDFDFPKWLSGHGVNEVDPIVTKVIKALREEYHVQKIGAVGYCFGAKYVIRFLGDVGKSAAATIDVGYGAHPSFVDVEELKAIAGPLSISAAEVDQIFPSEKRTQSESILKELSLGPSKIAYQMNLFSGTEHGFAVRGDVSNKVIRFAKEQAFYQAVQWFDAWLKA